MTALLLTILYIVYVGLLVGFVLWRYSNIGDLLVRHEAQIYWVFSVVLVAFTALRPFGAGLDDGAHYLLHYVQVCSLSECLNWFDKGRDFVWYLLVAVLKELGLPPQAMLWLVAAFLIFKLIVIRQLCQNLLLALLIYVTVFYQAHDMTSFRQSIAAFFYLLSFWALVRQRPFTAASSALLSAFTHKQAYIAPLLWLIPWINRYRSSIYYFIIACGVLIIMGLYPRRLLDFMLGFNVLSKEIAQFLSAHAHHQPAGWAIAHFKAVHLEIYPLTLGVLYLLHTGVRDDCRTWSYAVAGLGLAYLILWITAGAELLQYRLFYFFLLPLIFLVGCARLRPLSVPLILLIASLYVVKYDVLHPFFLDPARIHFIEIGGGTIERILHTPCGEDCTVYRKGQPVTFRASPDKGHQLEGWGGACSGISLVCSITLEGDGEVIARFGRVASLFVSKSGEGFVTALGGMKCGPDCEQRVDGGQLIVIGGPGTVLAANPAPGYRFAGWSGACEGGQPSCHLTLDQDRSVGALFVPLNWFK